MVSGIRLSWGSEPGGGLLMCIREFPNIRGPIVDTRYSDSYYKDTQEMGPQHINK